MEPNHLHVSHLPDDIHLIIMSYLPFVSNYHLRLTCKQQRGLFNKHIIPIIRNQLQERIHQQGISLKLPEFLDLGGAGAVISGGSLWALLLGEKWNGDIDIFNVVRPHFIVSDRFSRTSFANEWIKFTRKKIKAVLPDLISGSKIYAHGRFSVAVECNTPTLLNAEGSVDLNSSRKMFDICITDHPDTKTASEHFDIVGCGCIYDGKSIYIPEPGQTLNKRSRLRLEFMTNLHGTPSMAQVHRVYKYSIDRGIRIEPIDPSLRFTYSKMLRKIIRGDYVWNWDALLTETVYPDPITALVSDRNEEAEEGDALYSLEDVQP